MVSQTWHILIRVIKKRSSNTRMNRSQTEIRGETIVAKDGHSRMMVDWPLYLDDTEWVAPT